MSNERQLFRPEVVEFNQPKWLGEIVLIRPLSFRIYAGATLVLIILIAALFIVGSYTRRSTVNGELVPTTGVIKLYSQQPAIVLEMQVSEGQPVTRGQLLYVLSGERISKTIGDTQAAISRQVELRMESLTLELGQTKTLYNDAQRALTYKIETLKDDLKTLETQLEGQVTRTRLAEENTARNQHLFEQHYISKDMLQQKQGELLEQRQRLQILQRDLIRARRELREQQNEQVNAALKQQIQVSQLDRTMATIEQEFAESEARRRIVISAPEDGIVTAVNAHQGQLVEGSKSLLSIVPRSSVLQAQLYAPSKAIGFIKTGDPVRLRYQAYPYQKFGHGSGRVVSVSKTSISGAELSSAALPAARTGTPEPLYRITVEMEKQTVSAYGKAQALQAGMLLEADILLETRRLFEWVLEPLYSISGKL